jgi:hypothetical protein
LITKKSAKKWKISNNGVKAEPKAQPPQTMSTQTDISSRVISDIHEERMHFAEINRIQENTIYSLREEIRKLVTLKQYYPESEELILEEKEPSVGTTSYNDKAVNSLKDTFSFQIKTKHHSSVESRELGIELPIPPFGASNGLKASFKSDCGHQDSKQILRVSSHPLIKQAESFTTEGMSSIVQSIGEFFEFIKSQNLNEEILKYTEFTSSTIQRNLMKYEEFVDKTLKENENLTQNIDRINQELEQIKRLHQKAELMIKTIENNAKLESYDLLKEQKTLYKENQNLRQKVEKLEQKMQRKSFTHSPLGNKFSQVSAITKQMESPPVLQAAGAGKVQKIGIVKKSDFGDENTRSFINEVRNLLMTF